MGKTVDVVVGHGLSADEARLRIEALGDYYANRYGAQVSWSGGQARVIGKWTVVTLDVAVNVSAADVRVRAPDPGRLLRKKMIGYAERKLRAYLDPSVAVSALPRG